MKRALLHPLLHEQISSVVFYTWLLRTGYLK